MRDEDGSDLGRTLGDVAREISDAFVYLWCHTYIQIIEGEEWTARRADDRIYITVRDVAVKQTTEGRT